MTYSSVHAPVYGYLKGSGHTTALHLVYFARTFQIMKIVNRLAVASVLNVGGGEGFHNHLFENIFGIKSVLVDYNPYFLSASKEMFILKKVCADGRQLPFADQSFDLVTCIETIEHVKNCNLLVSELNRVARKFVLISTESYFETENQKQAFLTYIRETHPQFYRRKNRVEPFDINHFTKEDIQRLFRSDKILFFPQYLRKLQDRIAPIKHIRDIVVEMTDHKKIDRASRIIALFPKVKNADVWHTARISEKELIRRVVIDKPDFRMIVDQQMEKENLQTNTRLKEWWQFEKSVQPIVSEDIQELHIDEKGSKGVGIKWLTSDNLDASPPFCLRRIRIEPHGYTTRHQHDWEHQLYVLNGKGCLDQGTKNRTVKLEPGITVRIPALIWHQISCTSEDPLCFLDIIPSVTTHFGR